MAILNFRIMKFAVKALSVAGVLLAGCTVLEERNVCPCCLTVDFSAVDNGIREWQMWLFSQEGEVIFKDTIYRRSYTSPYVVEVPRNSKVQCLMWGNARGGTYVEEEFSMSTSLVKRDSVMSDSLFFYKDYISTMGENSSFTVMPSKEFATVDIYLQGWVGIDFDSEMKLVCASSGFYVNGEFYPGEVACNMQVFDLGDYYSHFRGRILRQADTENIMLSLRIWKLEINGSPGDTVVDMDIPIGRYLDENGYDIQSIDMQDITIGVDYSYNRLLVKAEDWEATYTLVEEI